jgi:hypothetical protein
MHNISEKTRLQQATLTFSQLFFEAPEGMGKGSMACTTTIVSKLLRNNFRSNDR